MYGQSWADLQVTPPAVAWRMLRTLRHDPPGRAARGDRRKTFDAALEQAEQFLTAAASAGTATRPVLIFYGLTQAGWAVAAADAAADGNHWRLGGGHGITTGPLQDLQRTNLADLTVHDTEGAGSFTRLANILSAASLPEPTALGRLWCLLPETERFPLPGMGSARPLAVKREHYSVMRGRGTLVRVQPVPASVAHRIPEGTDPSTGQEEGWAAERRRVADFLADYPGLEGWRPDRPESGPIGLTYTGPDSLQLPLALSMTDSAAGEVTDIAARTVGYRGQRYAFPRVGGSARPAHPFLLWWAITFGLSMLARYEPKGWAERISISSSADASPIEHLLDQALLVLPEMIHRTVLEAAGSPPST